MGFAERTFIVLDKHLVVGEFSHGDPHVEGWSNLQPYNCYYLFGWLEFCFFIFIFFIIWFQKRNSP